MTSEQIKSKLSKMTSSNFFKVVNLTTQKEVLGAAVEMTSLLDCPNFIMEGINDEVILSFSMKLLPLANPQQCLLLAEEAKSDSIATMFAKKLLPKSSYSDCEYLAEYGKTDEIALMFAEKLLSDATVNDCVSIVEYSQFPKVVDLYTPKMLLISGAEEFKDLL